MMIKHWIQAARPRTLPLASSAVLAAGASVMDHSTQWSWSVFVLALLTTLGLQVLSNFANDLGDYSHGVDDEGRVGPQRALQSGVIQPKSMRMAVIICAAIAFGLGVSLIFASDVTRSNFSSFIIFLIVGLFAIAAAIKYTVGKSAYGYVGLGDLAVFLFFGVIGVLGVQFLLGMPWHDLDWSTALCVGASSAAVLNANNLRDVENDTEKGKRTMVVMMGFKAGKWYQVTLLAVSIAAGCYSIWNCALTWAWTALLPLCIQLVVMLQTMREDVPKLMDRFLKRIALSVFAFSLIHFIQHFL